MELAFQTLGWEDYLYWQTTDRKILLKINELIKECIRDPFQGKGKPEPLKGRYAGLWSRRITDEHRLVYAVRNGQIHIVQCRFHYEK